MGGLQGLVEQRALQQYDIVTGAFDYTGRHIAVKLLESGHRVGTITRRPERSYVLDERVRVLPYFNEPAALEESLKGADTVYNTHWTRFDRGNSTFKNAIKNIDVLLAAAQRAGVRKFVHISVSNADRNPRFPYFRGKWEAEQNIRNSGIDYAILRPALIFGPEEILINNIYFFLRHFHAFAIPGDGNYKIQPIHVDDLAELAVSSAQMHGSVEMNVAGPEDFTFNELINLLKKTSGKLAVTIHVPPKAALFFATQIGKHILHDMVLTEDEINSLMEGLLESENPVRGNTKFSEWIEANRNVMGAKYANELRRHYVKS